ncbi:DUF2877 domain-containing protein [Bradyrhizobium jicamae]|uniref:DUF2877 domain-containing protein n=1 Tax=Bradyrhizobium jicamae TaxID=280332 RepID=A0ABS5FEW1_9BRAD|nr:DUF2877 domain-containing protein [Bradyrhizobium jicamae]MBR0795325.1 DUF2877 domain-containing protein [Bradyrhizobium jicamae]MBR0932747.1 DUF2877 domain-containing protein [Bradyrhizobium jicamae]
MVVAGQGADGIAAGLSGSQDNGRVNVAAATSIAVEVGLLAVKALRAPAAGRVVAVFERSFYAVVDENWICVGHTDIGSGPFNLLGNFRWSQLAVGAPVRFADPLLWVAGEPLATLVSTPVWAPGAAPRWSRNSLRRGLRAVDEMWKGDLTAGGLAVLGAAHRSSELSALARAAVPGFIALEHVITGVADDVDHETGLGSLIGLGPGLTPSGDDLIGGALIALAALGLAQRRDLLWRHCSALLRDTNDISRIHLQAAALGYGAAALHAALHATMSGDVVRLHQTINGLTAIGHTSGLDAFAGCLMVLRHVIRTP